MIFSAEYSTDIKLRIISYPLKNLSLLFNLHFDRYEILNETEKKNHSIIVMKGIFFDKMINNIYS